MRTSLKGVAEIIGHEGFVLSPYKDSAGVWTVFVGHTASAGSPDPATMPKGVNGDVAEGIRVFRRDLAKFERRVDEAVADNVFLAQHEFDALVSFDFNTGGIFRARLTRLLNSGASRDAVAAAFDGWHQPIEIKPRRDKEKRLFAAGVYSGNGRTTVWPADARGAVQWGAGRVVDIMPLVSGMVDANQLEEDARKDAKAAGGLAGGGVVTGGGSEIALPDLPTDDSSLRVFLIVVAIALAGAALMFGVRWAKRKLEARLADQEGAAAVIDGLKKSPPGDGQPRPLGKAAGGH